MFTVALLGSDTVGTRVARELVRRLPVPALHLRDGPRPDSSNRLPPAGWLLHLLPSGTSAPPARLARMRRLASWWYRRAGFIVILHGRAEVEGFRSRGWPSRAAERRGDLVMILDDPSPLPHGPTRLRALRLGRGARRAAGADAFVVVVDASRPLARVVDEVERPIRRRAARHLSAVEPPAPAPQPEPVRRRGIR